MNSNYFSPFFSILIPSYNRPEFLLQLLKSIFNSDFNDFEVIISDDCSPRIDDIRNAISEYRHIINFIEQPFNIGERKNKDFLIKSSNGKYNIIIGDDDVFTPNILSDVFNLVSANPDIDVFLFGYNCIDEKSRLISKHNSCFAFNIKYDSVKAIDLLAFDFFPLWFAHPNTFCCKRGIELSIGYDEDVGIGEDMLFLQRLIIYRYKIFISNLILFSWRKFSSSSLYLQSNQSASKIDEFIARLKICKWLSANSAHLNISDPDLFYLFKKILVPSLLQCGNQKNTFKNILYLHGDFLKSLNSCFFCLLNKEAYLLNYYRLINRFYRLFSCLKCFGFGFTICFVLHRIKNFLYK